MAICASVFDRRIEVWRQGPAAPNVFGEVLPNPEKVAEIWAAVNNRSAQERTGSGRNEASTTEVFTIRYSPVSEAVNPSGYHIRYQGRAYNIRSKTEVGYREAFDIIAEARADV